MPERARARPATYRLALALLAVLLPLATLGAGELVCRWRGFGGYPPLVARVGADGDRVWYATSRRATDTFFQGRSPGGGMREIQFQTPKPPNAVRIVFVGESAIQGFPQELPLTSGSFLEAMLRDVWTDGRRVEVLNLGATAVASFPIRNVVDAALEHEPDLVVLMAGSNEFYGAYGVSSLPGLARSPAGMRAVHWIRGMGLSQWLHGALAGEPPATGPLMERLATAHHLVRDDDPIRRAAAASLRGHATEMARRCASRGVPMIVCTIPTNERGLAPIGQEVEPELPSDRLLAFRSSLRGAEDSLASNPARAAAQARAALALWDRNARAHFLLAEALTALDAAGSPAAATSEEARREYLRARDLDTMPWRATSAAGEAARAAAGAGALLCDMEGAFRAASPGGVIGWELMDDHVHMSLRGQALFARTLIETLGSVPGRLHVEPSLAAKLAPWEAYAAGLGHGAYSDYVAAVHVRTLFEIPFMRQNNAAALARSAARCRELLGAMSPLDREAVAQWSDPTLHGASERPLEFVVGVRRMEAGDYAAAEPLFWFARAAVPRASLWRLESTWFLLRCRRQLQAEPTEEDRRLCAEAVGLGELLDRFGGAGEPRVRRYLGLAYHLAGRHGDAVGALEQAARASSGREGWEVVAALADSYAQLGRLDAARELLGRAALDPETADEARRRLQELEQPVSSPVPTSPGSS